MTKAEIRKAALEARNAMPTDLQRSLSIRICQRLRNNDAYILAKTLLLYANTGSEAATDDIFRQAMADKKTVYYPKVGNNFEMDFYEVTALSDLHQGAFHIREPLGNTRRFQEDRAEGFVFIIVPGAAFDTFGNRIGYGRGYYDRFLARVGAFVSFKTAGLCFPCQMFDKIPKDDFDISLNMIITSGEVFREA